MGSLWIRITAPELLLLCFQPSTHLHVLGVNHKCKSAWKPVWSFKYGRFLKSRTAYNGNSSASFILAGDIHSNPGPKAPSVDNRPNSNSNGNSVPATINGNSQHTTPTANLIYSRNQLFGLRHNHHKLPQTTWSIINSFGIRKRPRGWRTGVIKRKSVPITQITDSGIGQHGTTQQVKCCIINTQSVRNKTTELIDLVLEKNFDAVAISESWLRPDDSTIIGEITPNGCLPPCSPYQ